MDDNLTIFLLVAVAMLAAVVLTAFSAWTKARTNERIATAGGGADAARVETLESENSRLRNDVVRLEERLQTLERIATDPAERVAREIEHLR